MAVTVYGPALKVMLLKQVQRVQGVAQRYAGAGREVDLTPYLGERGTVQVVKSLREPCGGFTVAFADRVQQGRNSVLDSLAALIEPMDIIEIRACRKPHERIGQELPLLMRGFVSEVRRQRSMGQDGSPQATVVVSGQDSGKLWLIHQLIPEALYFETDDPYLSVFRLFARTGIEAGFLPVSEFMQQLTDRVINSKIAKMAAFSDRQLAPFTVRATVPTGIVPVGLIAPFTGAFWQLAEEVADRPWNELFVEDEEAGPVLVFRPAPFRDLDGNLILPGAADPGVVEVGTEHIVGLTSRRSDARTANFFWVPPGNSTLDSNSIATIASLASTAPTDYEHPNNKPELYGVRKMTVPSALLPDTVTQPVSHLPPGEQAAAGDRVVRWHELRMSQLRAMNRDNTVLEEGDMQVMGHEAQKPGRTLRVTDGSLRWDAYLTTVVHSFAPLNGWSASLRWERGNGFLQRTQGEASPYWAEGRRGPYDR